jgi:hypothetical protein
MSTANPPPGMGCSSACSPIQDTIRLAVTRYAKTTSGGASISIEVEKSAIVLLRRPVSSGLSLRGMLQRRQVSWPKPIEELSYSTQSVGAHEKHVPGAFAPFGDQARAPQHAQVMGNGLLGHRDLLGDFPDRTGLVANQREDPPAVAVSQGPQYRVDVCRWDTHASLIQAAVCTNIKRNIAVGPGKLALGRVAALTSLPELA